MASEVVMMDPPEPRAGAVQVGVWEDRLQAAIVSKKSRWHKWARVWETEGSAQAAEIARNIRGGRVRLPEGVWEAAARTIDGKHFVFVRYLGIVDTEATG